MRANVSSNAVLSSILANPLAAPIPAYGTREAATMLAVLAREAADNPDSWTPIMEYVCRLPGDLAVPVGMTLLNEAGAMPRTFVRAVIEREEFRVALQRAYDGRRDYPCKDLHLVSSLTEFGAAIDDLANVLVGDDASAWMDDPAAAAEWIRDAADERSRHMRERLALSRVTRIDESLDRVLYTSKEARLGLFDNTHIEPADYHDLLVRWFAHDARGRECSFDTLRSILAPVVRSTEVDQRALRDAYLSALEHWEAHVRDTCAASTDYPPFRHVESLTEFAAAGAMIPGIPGDRVLRAILPYVHLLGTGTHENGQRGLDPAESTEDVLHLVLEGSRHVAAQRAARITAALQRTAQVRDLAAEICRTVEPQNATWLEALSVTRLGIRADAPATGSGNPDEWLAAVDVWCPAAYAHAYTPYPEHVEAWLVAYLQADRLRADVRDSWAIELRWLSPKAKAQVVAHLVPSGAGAMKAPERERAWRRLDAFLCDESLRRIEDALCADLLIACEDHELRQRLILSRGQQASVAANERVVRDNSPVRRRT